MGLFSSVSGLMKILALFVGLAVIGWIVMSMTYPDRQLGEYQEYRGPSRNLPTRNLPSRNLNVQAEPAPDRAQSAWVEEPELVDEAEDQSVDDTSADWGSAGDGWGDSAFDEEPVDAPLQQAESIDALPDPAPDQSVDDLDDWGAGSL